jgi:Transposase DDE domain
MLDILTFLLELYAFVDAFCHQQGIHHPKRGRRPALSCAEVVTLAVFAQWGRFASERDFYRFAEECLRPAFPRLPHRTQFNRALRQHQPLLLQVLAHLTERLDARAWSYAVLDGSGVAVRNSQRRGTGWLPEYVEIGRCSRLGWYEGFHLQVACNPVGEITGFGFASANVKDQPLAEAFLYGRASGHPKLVSVGKPAQAAYLTDTGFEGPANHQRWHDAYGAEVVCAPRRDYKRPWPRRKRHLLASRRQIIETVFDRLLNTFRLSRERPHTLTGFWARLTAKMVLHNFCIWLNRKFGRPRLAFADLLGWK